MKQLEITTNKRLLIVEPPDGYYLVHFRNGQSKLGFVNLNIANPYDDVIDLDVDGKLDLICKGPDLTEDIAKGFIHQSLHTGLFAHYVKGIPVNTYCYKTALEAFDAVIYAYGNHWGENPVENPESMELIPASLGWWLRQSKKHEEAQARTFAPEKCIIFEIL